MDGDGKGSSQQSVASLREGRRQRHLTDFPRLLEIHGGEPGTRMELFHTPDTAPDAPNSGSNTRSKPAGVGNQVRELFPGPPDGELLPTPTSSQGRNETSGRQPGSRHNTGTTLNDVVFKGDIASTDDVTLLPTPRNSDAKGTDSPAERNRKSPGLGAIHFHLTGEAPDRAEGEELMGTPQARDWKGIPGRNFNSHNLTRDIDDMLRETGQAPLLPTPVVNDMGDGKIEVQRASDEKPLPPPGDKVALLPTPNVAAREVRNSPGEMARINPALGAVVADLAENGDQSRFHGEEGVKLLPTPTTLDHVEKRTTHAGGNPTLQGAVCGTNPVDAERLGLSTEDGAPLLPTPKTAEKRTSRRAALESHSRSGPSMGQALEIAQGVLPHEFQSWEELPPGWQPELLPTPQTRDATGGKPEAVHRGRGYGANLNDVAAAGLLDPDRDPLEGVVLDPVQAQIITLLETVVALLREGR